MITWWALKDKRGRILEGTIAPTKTVCWENGFWHLYHAEGTKWQERYWKKWDASIASALRLGYSFCRVGILEIKRKS